MGWIADYDYYTLCQTTKRWEPDRTYQRGEHVTGKVQVGKVDCTGVYQALKKNQGVEPHTDPTTWRYL